MIMKNLLERNFTSHYELFANVSVRIVSTINAKFDLKDDAVLVYPDGTGIAKYCNPNLTEVNVINYEFFFKSLPHSFQKNKNNCDLIVYTSDNQFFLLNELTKTGKSNNSKKRKHAIKQMHHTLQEIIDVAEIKLFIDKFPNRQCCYFNKKTQSPSFKINAPTTFGKISEIAPHGFKMSNPDIESLGFELWEFSGNQTYLLDVI